MGARARLRDLGDRAGLGAARAHRGGARRARACGRRAGRPGSAPRRRRAPTRRSRSPRACSRRARRRPRALAFQFASTNLVWELGLVLWVLIGWQFTLAEYVGGIVMIVLMWALLRLFVRRASRRRRASTRARPTPATSTTRPARRMSWRERLTLGRGLVGRGAQLPRRLADALEGDRASASCSPASSPCSATTSSTGCSSTDAPAAVQTSGERAHRPGDRGAELRLLGRQRAARRRAVVGRHLRSPA